MSQLSFIKRMIGKESGKQGWDQRKLKSGDVEIVNPSVG